MSPRIIKTSNEQDIGTTQQQGLKRKTNRRWKRPGIQHLYDTDTELVLTICLKNERRRRPKQDKANFEHPKRTVIYNPPNMDEEAEDNMPYLNNTITSVKIQQRSPGLLVPILIVIFIFLFTGYFVLFAVLFRPRD